MTVLDRAFLQEQPGQSVDERPGDLPVDLGGIDGVPAIRRPDDAVHLDLVAVGDRHFRARGHVAVERHHLGEAAIDAFRRRLAPAGLVGDRVQHGQVLRMVGHQLPAELERILAGGVREFVHEALDEDRVLVDVHAPPEPGRHVRVPHGVIDQQIRDRVAEPEIAARIEALEGHRILALLERGRPHAGEDRLTRQAHVQARQLVVAVEAAHQLALHDRVIPAVKHVFLA